MATFEPLEKFIERRLTRNYIRFVTVTVLVISAVLLMVSFASNDKGRTVFGPPLGGDFAAFYAAGKILNEHPHELLYDLELQQRVSHDAASGLPASQSLPYVYAPFFALLFAPLARLPYLYAYIAWLIISLGLYVAGLGTLWRLCDSLPRDWRSNCFLLAMSFMPFIMEDWVGGQVSAFGFLFLTLAIRQEQSGKRFLSGILLAFCLYKPTLLLLVVPMLVFTRRLSSCAGFIAGAIGLGLLSIMASGWKALVSYPKALVTYRAIISNHETTFPVWKFVDFNSFFVLLVGNSARLQWALFGASFSIGLVLLVRIWLISEQRNNEEGIKVWVATISFALLLNLYVPIYDTILIVPGIILTTNILYRRGALTLTYKFLLVLLYVVPWFTQPFARFSGLQPLTLVIAVIAAYQFHVLYGRARSQPL